jgi:hypothetical protein
MRRQNRNISGLAGIAALVLVALLLLGLFWLVCASVFLGREHYAPRL